MKKREKGFMLVETLIVSTLVSTVIIVLYLQFSNVVKNFNNDFNYNSVNNMYATQNIKKMIMNDNNGIFYTDLKKILDDNIYNQTSYFLEVSPDCNASSTLEYSLSNNSCTKLSDLTNFYGIERILFTRESVNFRDTEYNLINDSGFEKFIKSIKTEYTDKDYENGNAIFNYRIIIKFSNNKSNNQYATLKMSN